MCFLLYSEKTPEVKIAKKDIICWKILSNDNKPLYMSLAVRRGKTIKKEPYKEGFIYTEEAELKLSQDGGGDIYKGYIGFHSYKSKGNEKRVARMKIPKGTEYFENCSVYFSRTIECVKLHK